LKQDNYENGKHSLELTGTYLLQLAQAIVGGLMGNDPSVSSSRFRRCPETTCSFVILMKQKTL
jgi:hypothetical protein